MRKKLLSAAIISCFFYVHVQAQYDFSKVDAWLNANTREMGGRSILLVYKDGKVIYDKSSTDMTPMQRTAWRMVANRTNEPVNLNPYNDTTRSLIASCSKWYSAALVMTFVDEGKLKLTDTAGKYLPVLSANGKGNITISECLSHMTGIASRPLKEELQASKEYNSMDEAIAAIASQRMEDEPGKVFHYSNAGLQIAGAVIEKISGKSFETLFAERIAHPLNMKNTDYGHEKVALPAGGARSTPADYINFLNMILHKGMFNGTRILSEKSIASMQTNRIAADTKIAYTPAAGDNWGYGYGEWIMQPGTPDVWISSPGLFGSLPWVDYNKHYAAFLMTFYLQGQQKQARYQELKQLVDAAVVKK